MKGTWGGQSADAKSTADKTLDTIDRAEMDRRERQLIDRPRFQANDELYARKAYSQAKFAATIDRPQVRGSEKLDRGDRADATTDNHCPAECPGNANVYCHAEFSNCLG